MLDRIKNIECRVISSLSEGHMMLVINWFNVLRLTIHKLLLLLHFGRYVI